MTYFLAGHTAMLLHFAFLTFVVFGGFLTWRWPRLFWVHLIVAAYALGIVIIDWPCFLTDIENWARANTGRVIMENGFIDHYLTENLYPREHLLTSRFVIAGIVAVSYVGLAVILWRRRRLQQEGAGARA